MLRAKAAIVVLLAAGCSGGDDAAGTARAEASVRETSDTAPAEPRCPDRWREVEPGLRHRSLCTGSEEALHQVEVDPGRWMLDAARVEPATAAAVARDSGAAFAINANFFVPGRKTLGVVVSGGAMLQPPHPVDWQSIFYATPGGKAGIVLPEQWAAVRDDAAMAVQAGPRLVADGRPTGATRGTPSQRSGVCLTPDDRLIFFVTTAGRLYDVEELTELAGRAEDRGGLGCRDAMLFDGGPSAQMYLAGSDIGIEGDRVPAFVIARERRRSGDGR